MAEAGRERKFEYIYNNTYKPDYEKEDSNVAKDGLDVLCEFFLFSRHRVNKSSINWLFKHKKCNASITIADNKIIRYVAHRIVTVIENHTKYFEVFGLCC